jgi:hypothetical protein
MMYVKTAFPKTRDGLLEAQVHRAIFDGLSGEGEYVTVCGKRMPYVTIYNRRPKRDNCLTCR